MQGYAGVVCIDLQCKHRQVTYEYTGLRRENGYSQSCHCFWRTWVVCFPGTSTPKWEELFFPHRGNVSSLGHVAALNRRGEPLRPSSSSHLNMAWLDVLWFHQASQAETVLFISPTPLTVFRWGFLSVKSSNLPAEVCLSVPYATPFCVHPLCEIGLWGKKLRNRNRQLGYNVNSGERRENWKAVDKLKRGISWFCKLAPCNCRHHYM